MIEQDVFADIEAASAGRLIRRPETRKQARFNNLVSTLFTEFDQGRVNVLHFLERGSNFFEPADDVPTEMIREEEVLKVKKTQIILY